jgi:replicative DNA helicase
MILRNLLYNETYARKVLPFLKPEYFSDKVEKVLLVKINEFISTYNKLPNDTVLQVEISKDKRIPENIYEDASVYITGNLGRIENIEDIKWLSDTTEEFCKERAIYNAVLKSANLIDAVKTDATKKAELGAMPDLLAQALSVSFDTHIGHDLIEDAASRYDYYTSVEEKIPFDIDILNKITKGGVSKKTLSIILAGTGVGKTLAMCHMACANILEGQNVLYITMEMSEEKIAQRMDANLLDMNINDIEKMSKKEYMRKSEIVKQKSKGKLIIKEYPTGAAHVGHFRFLLDELKLKKKFIPDVIYIDYINICSSAKVKASVGMYNYVKSIAEEIRGLGVEKNIAIWSATQTNRTGYGSSDPSLTETSESFGLPMTADLMLGIFVSDAHDKLGQIGMKQLKNRYNDLSYYEYFDVGIDRTKMKWHNLENHVGPVVGVPKTNDNEDKLEKFDKFRL